MAEHECQYIARNMLLSESVGLTSARCYRSKMKSQSKRDAKLNKHVVWDIPGVRGLDRGQVGKRRVDTARQFRSDHSAADIADSAMQRSRQNCTHVQHVRPH